jgi:hypothetical protein
MYLDGFLGSRGKTLPLVPSYALRLHFEA